MLDLLRFLAALSVVSFHWIIIGATRLGWHQGMRTHTGGVPVPLLHAAAYGWIGVELFFLISGFVICMSSWGHRLAGFVKSRLARLMPAYWFSVAAIVILSRFPAPGAPARHGGLGDTALVNLTMLQAGYSVTGLSSVYWTLWVELWFYLIFSTVVLLGLTYRRVLAFCCLWLIGTVTATAANNQFLDTVIQPATAPFFIAGICFYLMRRYQPNFLLWLLVATCFLLGQHSVIDQGSRAIWGAGIKYSWAIGTSLLAVFFTVMAMVALGKLDRISWRGLTVLGALTYPLYLLHMDLGFAFFDRADQHLGHANAILAALPAVLILCWLVHRYVERPASRWIKHHFDRAITAIRAATHEEQHPASQIPTPLGKQKQQLGV